MKLSFVKQDLLKGLNISMRAIAANPLQNILKYILIDASNGDIRLISTDLEMAIETIIEGNIIKEGKAAIEGRIFYDIIRKLPDEDIIIEVNERLIVNIKCGKSEFNISGQDSSEFPYPPAINSDISVSFSQFVLKEMIRQTIFSLNLNENNKMMTGEMLEIKEGKARLVSLDGHRISIRNLRLEGNYENVRVIIPGKTLNDISKMLSDNLEDTVDIIFDNNGIWFIFGNTFVYTRLIDGDYFDIDRMISSEYRTKVTINKKEFYECVERAGLLIKEGEGKPIILNISEDNIDIDVRSALGTMQESMSAEKEGDDLKIGFNPRFLTETLRAIDDETIDFYLINKRSPGYIKDKEDNYLYFILPVNTVD